MPISLKKGSAGRSSLKRPLHFLILLPVICYAALALIALCFSDRMIFPYRGSSYSKSLPGLLLLRTADGTMIATRYWEVPEARKLVIFFHGNYEDLGQLDPIAHNITRLGYSMLAMDYRGYGLSEGIPTENRCYADARRVISHAGSLGFDESRIILWGRSLGSGVATQLALEINACALVLESPFTSAFRTLTGIALLPFDKFNNLAKMDKIDSALFIIHGENDTIIPAIHSIKLLDRHRHTKILHLIKNAGHNNLWQQNLEPAFMELTQLLDNSG
jgi:pimeloyl-ACP methyl ester carboxylesterase